MRFIAVLNRDGGTLRTTDLDAFIDKMSAAFTEAGHSIEIRTVTGAELEAALKKAASGGADVVIAGGGDGTISAAAAALMNSEKRLAVLPAGTMNLFARSLGIPLSLDAAMQAFVDADTRAVDMASANGRPFIHQFSIGMHAKMVDMRDGMQFRSKLGKIRASAKAALAALLDPPSLRVSLDIDGRKLRARTTSIGITNNLFGEGHLPYADEPDGGVLGIYVTIAAKRSELLRAALDILRGRWRESPHVDVHEGKRVMVHVRSHLRDRKCVIDGELLPLERDTVIRIHRKALRVLVTKQADARQEEKASTRKSA